MESLTEFPKLQMCWKWIWETHGLGCKVVLKLMSKAFCQHQKWSFLLCPRVVHIHYCSTSGLGGLQILYKRVSCKSRYMYLHNMLKMFPFVAQLELVTEVFKHNWSCSSKNKAWIQLQYSGQFEEIIEIIFTNSPRSYSFSTDKCIKMSFCTLSRLIPRTNPLFS